MLAMQALCQHEVIGDSLLAQLDEFLADESPPADVQAYARALVTDAVDKQDEIDDAIQSVSQHWTVGRMSAVDRNTLRVAAVELLYRPDVPPRVVINEAVEIGKAFGTAETGSFINGVLDAVLKAREAKAATSARSEAPPVG